MKVRQAWQVNNLRPWFYPWRFEMKSSPSKSHPHILFVYFETGYKMPGGNLRSSECARPIIQNLPAQKTFGGSKCASFCDHVWHDFHGVTYFFSRTKQPIRKHIANLAMASFACRHSLNGFGGFDADGLAQTKRVQTDLRLKSYFHPALRWGVVWKKYHGWCHQNGDTSLYPTCPSCCRLLACYPTVPQWISTRILPLIYGYKFMFCHHFQYSNIPRQIW